MTTYLVDNKDLNYPNADVILVSAANRNDDAIRREFRVHKLILSIVSPVFETMFTLPQSDPTQIQTVECPETEETLDLLLRYIYPIPDPTSLDLAQVSEVLHAAMKYETVNVITSLRALLNTADFLQKYPIGAYAITLRHGFEAERKTALRATLRRRILEQTFEGELECLDAYALYSLISFHNGFFKFVSSKFSGMLSEHRKRSCAQCLHILPAMAAILEKHMREMQNIDMTNSDSLLLSLEDKVKMFCSHLWRQNMSSSYEQSYVKLKSLIETYEQP